MGDALDAFDSVWQRAHATFGTGTPQTGEHFDKSAQLRGMQATVQSATLRQVVTLYSHLKRSSNLKCP